MTTVISVICVRLKYVIMITCRLRPKCIFLLILQFYRIFTPDMRFAFFIDIYITTTMGFTSLFPYYKVGGQWVIARVIFLFSPHSLIIIIAMSDIAVILPGL